MADETVHVAFGEKPGATDNIVAAFPLRVDSNWRDPHKHKDYECDPTPLRSFAEIHYPECRKVFALPHGEVKCACGYDNVFTVFFCK